MPPISDQDMNAMLAEESRVNIPKVVSTFKSFKSLGVSFSNENCINETLSFLIYYLEEFAFQFKLRGRVWEILLFEVGDQNSFELISSKPNKIFQYIEIFKGSKKQFKFNYRVYMYISFSFILFVECFLVVNILVLKLRIAFVISLLNYNFNSNSCEH